MFGSLRKEADFEYFSSWDWPLSQKKETNVFSLSPQT